MRKPDATVAEALGTLPGAEEEVLDDAGRCYSLASCTLSIIFRVLMFSIYISNNSFPLSDINLESEPLLKADLEKLEDFKSTGNNILREHRAMMDQTTQDGVLSEDQAVPMMLGVC